MSGEQHLCHRAVALLTDADAAAGCHYLQLKIRKAREARKAEISATAYKELVTEALG